QDPLLEEGGAQGLVEADGGLVPVEDAPFQPPAAALGGQRRQAGEEGLADARAAVVGLDEEVLEVEAGAAEEGREGGEEEREAHGAPAALGDERLAARPRAEERLVQQRRRAGRHVRELLVLGERQDEAQDLAHVPLRGGTDRVARARAAQNVFFHARISANTATGSASRRPAWRSAAATTPGSPQRRNGLVASSTAIVDGTVASPRPRAAASRALRRASSRLAGSTASAKRMFASVYSWAQYTRVAPGSAASLASEAAICAGVPSKSRPQPH